MRKQAEMRLIPQKEYTRRRPLALVALLLAGAAGVSIPSTAADAAEAEADPHAAAVYFRKARREASKGRYPTALRFLQRAYAADPQPKYVANQGVAYLKMKQYAEALERFEWFLERAEAPDDRALAESYLLKLRPQIIITSEPPGARVSIDQQAIGVTPLITEVIAGKHLLQLDLSGHRTADQALEVALNTGQNLHVVLEAAPVGGTPPPSGSWGLTEWGWTSIAVGGVAAAVGGTLGGLAMQSLDARGDAADVPQWKARQADAERYGVGMYTAGGVAVAALVTGVILLSTDASPASIEVGPGGVSVEGRF